MRAVVSNDTIISHLFYGTDEETVTAATGSVTVAISKADGTTLTGGTATADGDGYTFTLTAAEHTAALQRLKITWSATVAGRAITDVEYVDVIGARYFQLWELRRMKGLNATSQFTNDDLKAVRDSVEEFVDDFTENAWSERYARDTFDANDSTRIHVLNGNVNSIVAVTLAGVAQTLTNWTITSDGLMRTDGDSFASSLQGGQELVIEYTWGNEQCPSDLKQAMLKLARHYLLSTDSSIPDRARMMQTQFGMFIMDVASENKPTGLPEVDSVLVRRRYAQPHFIA